jgi:DNA-binding NtrC family response regulator
MKKILIIDENRFSRICSAILEHEGFETEVFDNIEDQFAKFDNKEFDLIITSYPFGHFLLEKIKNMNLPTIILTDHINRAFINLLEGFNNSYCMVKPLDYQEFQSLVKQITSCEIHEKNGLNIL